MRFGKTPEGFRKIEAENRRKYPDLGSRMSASWSSAKQQFREKPLATTGKIAALGLVASTGGVGALAVGGALAARGVARSAFREGGMINDKIRRDVNGLSSFINNKPDAATMEAYRKDQWEQRQAEDEILRRQERVEENAQKDDDMRRFRENQRATPDAGEANPSSAAPAGAGGRQGSGDM